jgi:hypothetical protein
MAKSSKSKKKDFYLGRVYDPKQKKATTEALLYEPADLTTHAVVTGMTGSGKTGLCVGLLEEAALQGIPAVVIDPKGDLTNLLLHFPDLLPEDFEPWIDPEAARRKGKSLSETAEDTANMWRNGLESWGLGPDDLLALKESVGFTVYTPGSTAGTAVNIMSSFEAPEIPWEKNSEILREKITSTVTALLGLVGFKDIDPLRSREHILLANLLETAWSDGRSFNLTELILQTQDPPFERLGAFPLDNFFPPKDRMDLAMVLNNFLAAPSFQSWMVGETLDIAKMMYSPDGSPRHSIFYLAHLPENERMFFVTLLYASIETWMRAQRGTSGLRSLVYFDEIVGYIPATSNPPSKPVMLRMLKQARAFGVGLVLATQNPIDIDYKALSNAGTWFVGRLQTERDKDRLMDGLRSAGGTIDIKEIDKLISGLGKRVFLYHSVHNSQPQIFQTRWVLNYLAGPITRSQIPLLKQLEGGDTGTNMSQPVADVAVPAPGKKRTEDDITSEYTSIQPAVPDGVKEFYLPMDLSFSEAVREERLIDGAQGEQAGVIYRPSMFIQAEVRYLSRKYELEHSRKISVMVTDIESSLVDWEEFAVPEKNIRHLDDNPQRGSKFGTIPDWLSDTREIKALKTDFLDWVYRNGKIIIRANEGLKIYAGPDVGEEEFQKDCEKEAQEKLEDEKEKLEASFDKKLDKIEQKILRQESEVEQQEDELGQRKLQELGTHGEMVLSLFTKRKRSISSSLTKRRMTKNAKAELEQEMLELEILEKQVKDLNEDEAEALQELSEKWEEVLADVSEIPITPFKKDILLEVYGVGWVPYYLVQTDDKLHEVMGMQI